MNIPKTTMGMLTILIFFFYNTQANEQNQFVLEGQFVMFDIQAVYDDELNVVIVDNDSLGTHLKLFQFDNSKIDTFRIELTNKEKRRDPRKVGQINLKKKGKDLFVTSGNRFYHIQKINTEYKLQNYIEFENIQHDAYVKDFDNYYTIAISTRMLPPGQDMNKWTMTTKDTIIKGVLPEFDNSNLLRILPRQPYDIFENKVLISNILKDSYYIIDLEVGTVKENHLNIFSGKSVINDTMNMQEVFDNMKNSELIIRTSFIDSNRIIITSKIFRNNIKELRHDIINFKENKILKTYYEPLYKRLTNKTIKFGQLYYVSDNKIISIHTIPFKVNKSDKEYSIKDSANNYYKYNFEYKSLIRIDEI